MRSLCFAITVTVIIATSAAAAENFSTWTDPTGHLRFEYPSTWSLAPQRTDVPGEVRAMTGAANYECQIFLLPHPSSASATPEALHQMYSHPIAQTEWVNMIAPLGYYRLPATVSEATIDASSDWPTQHATLTGDHPPVYATLRAHPGLELISVCHSFDGVDRKELFDQIAASVTTP